MPYILVQVLVLADLHNTTQLKLHVLKFINDRRVAEASSIFILLLHFNKRDKIID